MTDEERDFDEELWRVASGLAESAFEASDEEIREDYLLEGKDPNREAEHTRHVLLGAVATFRREEAKKAYRASSQALEGQHYSVPATRHERLKLLSAVMAQKPELQRGLTIQYRELGTLTDEDITSQLNQLAALGVLAQVKNPPLEDPE